MILLHNLALIFVIKKILEQHIPHVHPVIIILQMYVRYAQKEEIVLEDFLIMYIAPLVQVQMTIQHILKSVQPAPIHIQKLKNAKNLQVEHFHMKALLCTLIVLLELMLQIIILHVLNVQQVLKSIVQKMDVKYVQ